MGITWPVTSQSHSRRTGGEVLLDRRGTIHALHLFDVGGHRDRGNLREREPARVAPGEEPRHGRAVRRARVRVADLGGEKLHGPLGGLRPGAEDRGREAPRSASRRARRAPLAARTPVPGRPAAAGPASVGESAVPSPLNSNITSFMLL